MLILLTFIISQLGEHLFVANKLGKIIQDFQLFNITQNFS